MAKTGIKVKNLKNKYYLSEIKKHNSYLKKYYQRCLKIEELIKEKKMSNKIKCFFEK